MLGIYLYNGDVRCTIAVRIGSIDLNVLQPLDVGLKIAHQPTVEPHGISNNSGLIFRSVENDWRVGVPSCQSTNITLLHIAEAIFFFTTLWAYIMSIAMANPLVRPSVRLSHSRVEQKRRELQTTCSKAYYIYGFRKSKFDHH
jgi:hypothetical protein